MESQSKTPKKTFKKKPARSPFYRDIDAGVGKGDLNLQDYERYRRETALFRV